MQKNRLLILFSSLIAIYAIVGFVALPKILKPQIVKAINENITQKASLKKIEFNPFLLKFSALGLKIFDENETTIEIEKLFIDFSIFKSIDEQHISFKDLEIVNPYINIIQYEDGSLNLEKLTIPKKEEKKEENKKSNSDIKFQIYRTILDNAKIKFTKLIKNEEPFKLDIDKLNYTFYDMGTFKNTLASHSLKILINKNSELEINGGLRLDPFEMNGNVDIKNFKPKEFLTYKKEILNFDLDENTYLNLQFGYKVNAKEELKIELNNANLDLKNLNLKQNNNSILSLKHLAIDDLNLNYPKNVININSIYFDSLNSKIIKNKNNQLNLANLIKNEIGKKTEVKPEIKNEAKSRTTEESKEAGNLAKIKENESINEKIEEENKNTELLSNSSQKKDKPWKINLNELLIKNSNISFQDAINSILLDTKNINIDLKNFKVNGNNFTLEKISIAKPTISFKDENNKLNILNKQMQVLVSNLNMKDSILNLSKINLNTNLTFNDRKNSLSILSDNIAINLSSLAQKEQSIDINNLSLSTPKIDFKDEKNKLNIFTKKLDLNISSIKKDKEDISIENIALTNPSIFLRDYKNSLKIITNSLNIKLEKLNLKNADLKVNKLKVSTPSLVFNDLTNKMDITTKNINIITTNTSLIKEKLKVDILSLTKPDVYFVDNKNNTSLIAKDISLKINDIYNYKDQTKVSKLNLYEPNLVFKDLNSKTNILAKNIYLNVQKISNSKNKLKIERSSLNKPYISLTLGKQEIKKEEIDESKKPKEKERSKVVKKEKKKSDFSFDIGPIKIKDMNMTFEDKNLPIVFKTDITKLNGEFSRLNSNSSKPTKLSLEGKVDEYGYTKITGTVDINDIKLLTDTNLLFKNIAIKNFTPYSGKFIGREIESGKLNLDLKYNIKKSDLNAQNSIVISDIKLGKNVESPDAVNLPLELAIALLENSDGVIDLELPVSGNVDDPQFSIAPIVWKVFTNLIVKAITSPFALLGSLLGIDEEKLKSLEFEFGKSEILASEKESLDNIAKILVKKPKLAIKINPAYDLKKDKEALQNIKFEQFLIKRMNKIPEGDEYKEALEELYKDIDGLKLDDVKKQFTKKAKDGKVVFKNDDYVEYLRKFLASKEKVNESELINLSKKRVDNILNYLLKIKKIDKNSIKLEKVVKQNNENLKWAVFNLEVSTR